MSNNYHIKIMFALNDYCRIIDIRRSDGKFRLRGQDTSVILAHEFIDFEYLRQATSTLNHVLDSNYCGLGDWVRRLTFRQKYKIAYWWAKSHSEDGLYLNKIPPLDLIEYHYMEIAIKNLDNGVSYFDGWQNSERMLKFEKEIYKMKLKDNPNWLTDISS